MRTTTGPLLIVLLQGIAGSATAAPALSGVAEASNAIAVIVPAGDNSSMVDALTRLRGEAASVGFEIRMVENRPGVATAEQLKQVASEIHPAAVVALGLSAVDAGTAPAKDIDVWFLDGATGKTSVGHLPLDEKAGDRADLLLAVRAVDFIRARMFDSLVQHKAQAHVQRPVAVHATVGRGYVAAGVAGTGSFSGFSVAFMPFIEVGFAPRAWLRLSLGAGGGGGKPRKGIAEGSAVIDQSVAMLSLALSSPAWWRLSVFGQAGACALRVQVHGEGSSGYIGHDRSAWSAGLLGAAGLEVVLATHVSLHFVGGTMVLAREPKVVIADREVARTGRPAWLASSTLGVTF